MQTACPAPDPAPLPTRPTPAGRRWTSRAEWEGFSRPVAGRDGWLESYLAIQGMHCAVLRAHGRAGPGAAAGRATSVQVNGASAMARLAWSPRAEPALALAGGAGSAPATAPFRPATCWRRAAPEGAAPAAVALAGRGLLHDAGDDVRRAGLRRRARRDHARHRGAAALGLVGADAAGGAVFLLAVLRGGAARPAPPRHRHGRAGGAGHRHRVRRQHGRHLRSRRPAGRRGLVRLGDDVRVLPAVRAGCWSSACATARPARSRR